jgi:hypothetical protein
MTLKLGDSSAKWRPFKDEWQRRVHDAVGVDERASGQDRMITFLALGLGILFAQDTLLDVFSAYRIKSQVVRWTTPESESDPYASIEPRGLLDTY